jgi:hypothetical protein
MEQNLVPAISVAAQEERGMLEDLKKDGTIKVYMGMAIKLNSSNL